MAFTLFLVMSLPLAIKIHDEVLKVHCISSEILSSHMIQRSCHVTGSDLIPCCPFSHPTLSCLFPFIQLCLFPTLLLYCHCWVASSVWHCSTFLDSAVWQVWYCSTWTILCFPWEDFWESPQSQVPWYECCLLQLISGGNGAECPKDSPCWSSFTPKACHGG